MEQLEFSLVGGYPRSTISVTTSAGIVRCILPDVPTSQWPNLYFFPYVCHSVFYLTYNSDNWLIAHQGREGYRGSTVSPNTGSTVYCESPLCVLLTIGHKLPNLERYVDRLCLQASRIALIEAAYWEHALCDLLGVLLTLFF